jgi:hypothetical protein
MKAARLRALVVLVPLATVAWAGYLLFTDPSDISYECPGTTWTLLHTPAPDGPGTAPEFFDAGRACNAAAGARTRTAATVMLSGLSLVLVATATDAAAGRSRRQ